MFRSRTAEAYFNKINKNKKWKAESAGAIKYIGPLNKPQVKVIGEFGIKLTGKSRGLDSNLIGKQDLIIIVADDVPKKLFNCWEYIDFKKTRIIQWKIQDNVGGIGSAKTRRIVKLIIKKVDSLVKQLEKEK